MSRNGIANDTTVVFYGDKNNWWAAYAYWFFKLNGHENLKIMDGGRAKWEAEGREYTRETPHYPATNYTPGTLSPRTARLPRRGARIHRLREWRHGQEPQGPLVDVRSPQEYSGELMHMPAYPQEGALRGGHIPGAENIPWAKAVAEDGTFKPIAELRALYEGQGITPDKDVIAYCRIGERSSHTWFVLHELLGYKNVRNYDGSWTEWGNVVGVPIEK